PRMRTRATSHPQLERGVELLKGIHVLQQVEILQEIKISSQTRLLNPGEDHPRGRTLAPGPMHERQRSREDQTHRQHRQHSPREQEEVPDPEAPPLRLGGCLPAYALAQCWPKLLPKGSGWLRHIQVPDHM